MGVSTPLLHVYTGKGPRSSGGGLLGWFIIGLLSSSGLKIWHLPRVADVLAILTVSFPKPFVEEGHQLSQLQKHLSALELGSI